MGRAPCCDKANVKKGPWSPEEDAKLKEFIEKYGTGGNWIALPQKAGLKRCGKSCRLRWLNYLRPNIRHGEFSDDEDMIIFSLYASIGSRWSVIAAQLPGRTDNDIKNYWNTRLKKKLLNMYPSIQEKQSFFPSIPFQPPQLPSSPYDHHHHTTQLLLNTSPSFYNFTPNLMNIDNNPNSLFVQDHDHINVTNLSSPQPPVNNLMNNNININVNDNYFNYLGFQDDHHSMCNSTMQEYYQNALFGRTSCSSSEGGSYNKDLHQNQQYQIKQENDQITLHDQVLGDQIQSHSFMVDQKPKQYMIENNVSTPLHNDLEEMKQLNFSSYYY